MHPRLCMYLKKAQAYIKSYDDQTISPRVDLIIASKRPQMIDNLLSNINAQTAQFERFIFIPQGFTQDEIDKVMNGVTLNVIKTVLTVDDSFTVGARYNEAVQKHSVAPIIMHMDDDDIYLPNYAKGMIGCHLKTGKSLVSKPSYAVLDVTTGNISFNSVDVPRDNAIIGSGCSLLYTRDLYNNIGGFSETLACGYDADLFKRAYFAKYPLGHSDPFNMIYRRGFDDHTWVADIKVAKNVLFKDELVL